MSKPSRNQLTLAPMPDGTWRLFGYVLGKKIRKQSRDSGKLLALKESLEGGVSSLKGAPTIRHTWLTESQLREAEAATLAAKGRNLGELVAAGVKALGDGVEPMECGKALEHWLRNLRERQRRFPATVEKNKNRVAAFLRQCPATMMADITPNDVERWVLRAGVSARTQLTDGAVLRTFFNYAVKMKWRAKSPVEVDLRDLLSQARPQERPRIMSAAQCHALLDAARSHECGAHVPFVILSTWCFMRAAEVRRTRWADINLDPAQARVEINPRKRGTASYRVVTLPECARAELAAWKAKQVPSEQTPIAYNRSRFEAVREAAGLLTRGPAVKRHARRNITESLWQPNILRHTGISYLYQKTGDIREVCRQAGNSSDTAFKHYLHLPKPGECEAFYRIKNGG